MIISKCVMSMILLLALFQIEQSCALAADSEPTTGAPVGSASKVQTIPAGEIIWLCIDTPVSMKRSKPGDLISAHVIDDLRRNGKLVIPAGAPVQAAVVAVAPRTMRSRASVSLQFNSITIGARVIPVIAEVGERGGGLHGKHEFENAVSRSRQFSTDLFLPAHTGERDLFDVRAGDQIKMKLTSVLRVPVN
jgi:hypothetical protein